MVAEIPFKLMDQGVKIIAECAQGYACPAQVDSMHLAMWLVKAAKCSGADSVKFQLVIADELACPSYKHYNLFKSLELGESVWSRVASVAKSLEIELIFDIFGKESLQIADRLGVKTIKIHPTDFCNVELLRDVSSSESICNVIAGCGGATQEELNSSLNLLKTMKSVTLLLGFQGYPTSRSDNCLIRLKRFAEIAKSFGDHMNIGFADHADPDDSDSTHLAVMALGFGATVIEKHFTLARCLKLEDHESALSPDEFKNFVDVIRACVEAVSDTSISSSSFDLPETEQVYRSIVSRHVVASRDIHVGERLSESDLCLKRSESVSPITELQSVIGKFAIKPISANSPISLEELEK